MSIERGSHRFLSALILVFLMLFIMTLFFPVTLSTAYAQSAFAIDVGITLSENTLRLSFAGGYSMIEQKSGTALGLSPGDYRFSLSGNNIEITDAAGKSRGVFPGPLYLKASGQADESTFTIKNAVNGKDYRGELRIARDPSAGNRILAVNVIDPDAYLRGVLPLEMPVAWGVNGGMEALKAQAVAARTYAFYQQSLSKHSGDGYNICDSVHCQLYGGKNAENPNTDPAVSATRGEILCYDGIPIEPLYHASNGGYTELAQNVWNSPYPYFRSEPDPYDNPANPLGLANFVINPSAIWRAEFSREQIAALLVAGGYPNPGRVESITVASTFPSGRVNELVIRGTGGTVTLAKAQIRTALGADVIRSGLFGFGNDAPAGLANLWIASGLGGSVKKEGGADLGGKWVSQGAGEMSALQGSNFTVLAAGGASPLQAVSTVSTSSSTSTSSPFIFSGFGYGHGVGMSQYGACNRSIDGHSYRSILSFYYPGTEINFPY